MTTHSDAAGNRQIQAPQPNNHSAEEEAVITMRAGAIIDKSDVEEFESGESKSTPAILAAPAKEQELRRILREMESVIVAFSGGVDSAYLAYAAADELGDRALAVTGESPSYPDFQRQDALAIVKQFSIPHEFINTDEINDPNYQANPANRCYFCKHELFTKLSELAAKRGYAFVCDGNNTDDVGDYRPGRRAAKELKVRSPLIEAGLTKAEIRALSQTAGLPVWDRPASACLSSRIPYGMPVTIEKLSVIERGEARLRALGFNQMRVRHHGDIVRIEIAPEEMPRALDTEMAKRMAAAFKQLGFKFVTLDLEGYRAGALNETLPVKLMPDGSGKEKLSENVEGSLKNRTAK